MTDTDHQTLVRRVLAGAVVVMVILAAMVIARL